MPNPSDGYVGIAWKDAHGKMDEYIRKEALMEWIQTELKLCEGAAAMTRAYHKLIDKLSSL